MVKIKPEIVAIFLASFTALAVFLFWHYDLGINRYFDVDEYAHLHWTAKMLEGKKPYIDFLSFFPPGYALSLMPAFAGGWGTTEPFVTARFLTFLVFAGICAASSYLFFLMRRSLLFLLPAVILAFLPLPFDKYLEIRPDNLATLLTLLAIIFQVRFMDFRKPPDGFLTGFFYVLSLLVLPKMAPNAAVGILILFIYHVSDESGRLKEKLVKSLRIVRWVGAGIMIPATIFGVWALSLGNLSLVWYSLTVLPIEANKISQWFIMMPDLFFYPNGIYYGQNGWHKGLYLNHLVYFAGSVMAVGRLFLPHLASGRKRAFAEMLVASQFLIQVYFYVKVVPLKHAQYLIPIGVFAAWYMADAINLLWTRLVNRTEGRWLFIFAYSVMLFVLYDAFIYVNGVKKSWTNRESLVKLQALYNRVPLSEPVLDLDGRFLFHPDPYYACCIPFGQFAGFLSRPLPSLTETLAKNGVKYINDGELKRVGTLSAGDQVYINSFYKPADDPIILVRKE